MAKISTYPLDGNPKLSDKLIGTSVGEELPSGLVDPTYNFSLQQLLNLFSPLLPGNTLQGVLDNSNTATQDINLFGKITTTEIEVTDITNLFTAYISTELYLEGKLFDSNNSEGVSGQILSNNGNGVEWITPVEYTPSLQEVLTVGNIADIDIILTANITAEGVVSDVITCRNDIYVKGRLYDWNNSSGTTGQMLISLGNKTQWQDVPVYTASSPLFINPATKNITIQKANSTQNGYLSFADWISFDGKQNALSGAGIVVSNGGTISYIVNNSSNWNSAYNDTIVSVSVTGATTKTLKLTQRDGDVITTTFTDEGGGIGSIGLTMPSAFSVANSPLTSNGVIEVTAAGTSLEYIKGDGTLGTFPLINEYVPTSRQLTINGTAYDLSANRSWNVGTVTSVGLTSVTNGVTIGSSPITTNGNIALSIATASGSEQGLLSSADWNTFNNKQAAGNYITSLTGEATASGPGAASVTLNNASVTGKLLTGVNITGGTVLATDSMLTAFGKLQNQINSLFSGSSYQGVWNAATNTPTLTSSVGTDGYYYVVNVEGNTNLNGITDWKVGDWAIFHGGTWQKVDNTESVSSVNGQIGAVSLTTDNISEGSTNLYFTDGRARAALSFSAGSGAYNSTTGVITIPTNNNQIINGSNFITLNSLSAGTGISYNNTTGVITSTITQYTDALARTAISLTTTGTSGLATYNSTTGVLNIPNYASDLSGFVPYTGATANVNLGIYTLLAKDLVINHSSGSGVAASITKNGNGEALTVVKGSGSGNAASITGGITLLSELHLNTNLADAYIASAATWNAKQNQLNGTGFVKISGTTITYDNSTYYLASNPNAYISLTSLSAGTGISYNNTTGVITSTITQYTDALARTAISLTTTGTSGPATYDNTTGVLNIPQYSAQSTGTVTSVAALTLGTSGTDLSSTVANSTTTPVITLNVPTASATNRGALSSADWTTFNNKQNALTNPITGTGTGTTNFLPKFTGSTTLADSQIFDNGTNVSIGTSGTTGYKFSVIDPSGSLGGIFIGNTNTSTSGTALQIDYRGVGKVISYGNPTELFSVSNTGGGYFAGNVGIGTTSPSNKLSIEGSTARIDINDGGGASKKAILIEPLGYGGNSYARIESYNYGTSTGGILALNATGGNVGIGTSNADARLRVSGTYNGTQAIFANVDGRGLEIATSLTAGTNEAGSVLNARGAGSGTMIFQTEGSERMRITSGGNVGIGTTSPATKLQIEGTGVGAWITINRLDSGSNLIDFTQSGTRLGYFGYIGNDFYLQNATNSNTLFTTNNTERMRITSGGNVGIGTTSPGSKLSLQESGGCKITVGDSLNKLGLYADNNQAAIETSSSVPLRFIIGGNDVMRITSSGNVGIGTTSPNSNSLLNVNGNALFGTTSYPSGSIGGFGGEQFAFVSGVNAMILASTAGAGAGVPFSLTRATTGPAAYFFVNGSPVGNIDLGSSSTSYNTSSDYRLKEDLRPINGLDIISEIKVYDYKWKSDKTRAYGVLAHELQEVIPQAVSGEKDAERMQGVDYSKLVPILVQAIKELKSEIEILKNK